MVSTHSRAGVNKQADAGPSGPTNITPDLAAILNGQTKMQQELADLKKRSADEMEVLRQENSCLRRKIEADPTLKGKAKEASEAARSPTFQPTEEESEYNPTLTPSPPPNKHPFPPPIPLTSPPPNRGTTQPLPLLLPSPPPRSPTTYPPPYTLPTSHLTTHITFRQLTSPSQLHLHHSHSCSPSYPPIRYHPNNLDVATPSPTSSPTPLFPPSGNPSHWTATPMKLILTNILKSTSPMSPFTRPKTQSFAKPSPPPSRAPL